MATDDHDLDDFDLDDGLDLPDFDESMLDGTPNRDRKPIEKITGGFFDGVKSAATNSSTQKKMIETALPKGYGKAAEDISAGLEIGQDLYNTAKDQLRPVQRDMKRVGRFISQKSGKFLPEGVKKKLDELSTESDDTRLSAANMQDQEINAGLESIFGASLELESKRAEEEQVDRVKKEVLGKSRFDTQAKLLDSMRSGVERLVGYQDRVTANYQRKSLELQYRQFFVAKDHYALFEGHVAQSKELLQTIAKNSSLPDFVKTRKSETASLMLRERMLSQLGGKLSNASSDFREKFTTKLNTAVKDFSGKVAGGISQAAQGIEMAADSPGIDVAELGGNAAGSLLGESGLNKLAERLGVFLGKNEKIRTLGNNLNYMSDNKDEIFRNFIDAEIAKGNEIEPTSSEYDKYGNPVTDSYEEEYDDKGNVVRYDSQGKVIKSGIKDLLKNPRANIAGLIRDLLPEKYTSEASFGVDALTLKEEGVPFNALTDKSITEIIPGLLSEILKETEMVRTGSESVEKRIFDFESGGFSRESEVQVKLVERALPKGKFKAIREDLTSIVDDVVGTNDLSDSARAAFTRQLLKDASNNEGFSPSRYFSPNGLSTVTNEKDVAEIRQLIAKQFLDDDGNFDLSSESASKLRDETSEKYRYLKESIPDYQETIGKMANVYGFDILRQSGLLADTDMSGMNKVDNASILNKMLDEDGVPKIDPLEERLDKIKRMRVDVGPNGEDLNVAEEMIKPYADIPVSVDLKGQFEGILKALANIDPRKHLEINGEWLKKIYELLLGGGGGGNTGGSGGGPKGGPTGKRSYAFPTKSVRNFGSRAMAFGQSVGDKVKSSFEDAREEVKSRGGLNAILNDMLEEGKAYTSNISMDDMSSKAKGVYKDLDIEGKMKRYKEMAKKGMSQTQIQIEYYKDKLMEEGVDLKGKAIDSIDDLQKAAENHYQTVVAKGSEIVTNASGQTGNLKSIVNEKTSVMSDRARGIMADVNKLKTNVNLEGLYSGLQERATAVGQSVSSSYSDFDGLQKLFGDEAINDSSYMKAVTDVISALNDKRETAPDADTIKKTLLSVIDDGKSKLSTMTEKGVELGDELGLMSKEVMEDMVKNIGAMLKNPSSSTDVTTTDEEMDGEYWGRAQSLLERLMGHLDEKTEQLQDTLSNLTMATIAGSDVVGGSPGALKKLGKGVLKSGSGILSFYGNTFKAGGKLALAGAKLKINLTGKAMSAMFGDAEDIYLAGNPKPIVLARDLKAGNIFDQKTNAEIKSLADIKGAVVDRQGNVLISEEDVNAKRLYNKQGRNLKLPNIKGMVSGLNSYMTSPYKAAFSVAKGIFNRAKSFITSQSDLYVKGESSPKLLASVMKNGGYVSAATGKVIQSEKDIDGEVKDLQGNVVLTLEEFKGGLITTTGKRVRGVFNKLKGLVSGGVSRVAGLYRGGYDLAKKGLSSAGQLVGLGKSKLSEMDIGSFDGLKLITKGNEEQTEILKDIRNIIDTRLDKPIKGDRDGDGYREGGWRDKLYGKKDDESTDTKKSKSRSDRSGKFGLAGMLSGLFGMGGDEDEGSGYGGPGVDIDIDRKEKSDKDNKRKGRDGGGKKKSLARRIAGRAGRGVAAVGRGGMAVGRTALSLGARALPMLATAAPAIASGIGAAASAVGTGLAALGTGAAAVLSSPVLLTAGAIAAVGTAGYFAYKYFTGGDNGPLHRVRLAQYGADPDNKDHIGYIESLEDDVIDEVQFRKDQPPIIGGSIDIEDLMDDFDVDLDDSEAVSRWLNWFQNRFKPVFLSHVSVLRTLDPDADLDDVDDDLDDELKAKYLKKTRFPDGAPYQVMTSPFEDASPLVGADVVAREYAQAVKEFPSSVEEDKPSAAAAIPAAMAVKKAVSGGSVRSTNPVRSSSDIGVGIATASSAAAAGTLVRDESFVNKLNETTGSVRSSAEFEGDEYGLKNTQPIPTSLYDESIDEERLEKNRQRDMKVSQQTSIQTASMSTAMAHSMDKMTEVLINSHKVQRKMATSLNNLDKHFRAIREKELAEEQESVIGDVKNSIMNYFTKEDKKDREVKASVDMSK